MKQLLLLFTIFSILVACTNKNPSNSNVAEPNSTTAAIQTSPDTIEPSNALIAEVDDDCIFDQATQTDDFLKDISEFEGYQWDQELKTATIILKNNDTLLVQRGGCNHFGVSAEFILRNDTIDYKNWENVFERVIWTANQLKNEFAEDILKSELDSSNFRLSNSENSTDILYFSNEYLQMNNYEIVRIIEEEKTIIILSYYIN